MKLETKCIGNKNNLTVRTKQCKVTVKVNSKF